MNNDSLRALERGSIATFVSKQSDLYRGSARVLDFGCGKQPYRDLVEKAGGAYEGYDRAHLPANVSEDDVGDTDPLARDWDVILVTQVIQYVPPWLVADWLTLIRNALYARHGTFLMTGPTSWPLVENQDICRYTPQGMQQILEACGFLNVDVQPRAPFMAGTVQFVCGWQAVAEVRAT